MSYRVVVIKAPLQGLCYGDEYKGYLRSWADPQNSYFDQTEEMNIQKLMIERLMQEPLHQL